MKYYCSNNNEQFIVETEIVELYNLLLTKSPIGLKNLIDCSNNVLDNKDNLYNIVKCIRGQMAWWWVYNAYGQTDINMDDMNYLMLIIIWLLTMIEENKATVKEIMTYDTSTNQVTIINDNLKQTFRDSVSSDSYYQNKLIQDASNNYVMDIMLFHGIFKQYMYNLIDIKKTVCDCDSQYTSLSQAQKQQVDAQFNQVLYEISQARMQKVQAEMDAQAQMLQAQANQRTSIEKLGVPFVEMFHAY